MNIFFWIVVGFLLAVLLLLFLVIWKMGKRRLRPVDKKAIQEQWEHAMTLRDTHPTMAILEADKILDYALRQLRYRGSLGDKLKAASAYFSDVNGVWSAHKLRNKIAHEMNYAPKEKEVQAALASFKRALHDLKAL